ncbi:MAG: hypothetical protein GOMPHAMPRED_005156 [Gomphillus americanus]|uniref:GPI mannosyltransferase 1 n=1 Tax=Gomphillus americanus TaxID=1940652 RepID=A0A8H3FSH9_9LECA|nr:MAG: hypothetical protein GOMPHAMPRED_005156 [Gomphillus americanus]
MWKLYKLVTLAALLRLALLLYGLYQDANSSIKYTDIDYLVFTDAARYVSIGESPYKRETYRYTPLLAWILLPTTWPGQFWFAFGKILFALADLGAGYLLYAILRFEAGLTEDRALKFAGVWLLNPMVATISTRGSSEGLLGLLVVALLWAAMGRHAVLSGFLLGLSVHVKIYPFIYAPSLLLFFESGPAPSGASLFRKVKTFVNGDRITLALFSWITFAGLNAVMFLIYGREFVQHTFLHHLTRIDHRHNFSPYNILLYASSARAAGSLVASLPVWASRIESLAFIPQLSLSAVLIPLALAKKHLPSALLAQTLAFVTLNKVCTSQYFLWYLVLLPLYLPHSSWLQPKASLRATASQTATKRMTLASHYKNVAWQYRNGLGALIFWVGGQALWLQQGYQLEFLGKSTFVPGIWAACLTFYGINMWILGVIVTDASLLSTRSKA